MNHRHSAEFAVVVAVGGHELSVDWTSLTSIAHTQAHSLDLPAWPSPSARWPAGSGGFAVRGEREGAS